MTQSGILLTNIGTPDAPTVPAVRRFLREFLSDRRVVDAPRLLWPLILNGWILPLRAPHSASLYTRIWTPDGSPLLVIARQQAAALAEELARRLTPAPAVALGMRYGEPSIRAALEELRRRDCRRILIFPLFPQSSAAATGSALDAAQSALEQMHWSPPGALDVRHIGHYYDDPGYIAALAGRVREAWQREGEPDRLLISFHSLPLAQAGAWAGLPYPDQCRRTAQLLAEALDLPPESWAMAYQSRMGRGAWLGPFTFDMLEKWGTSGVDYVDVICPGFAADCLETLEEIRMRGREVFLTAGGQHLRYLSALNARPDHIQALTTLIARLLRG